jgi:hypothetical protein
MTRTNWLRTAAALLALTTAATLAPAAPVPGDKGALALVPASAPVVVHVRGAEGTSERLLTLLKNALPDVHPLVAPHIESALKDGIEGRKLRGVAKDGPIFVVFLDVPDFRANQPPNVAVVVGVTKYEEFRDNVLTQGERKDLKEDKTAGYEMTVMENDQSIYFVNKKDYAVVTPSKETAAAFAKGQPGMDTKVSKELTGKLLASDVGLFLRMDTLNKQYADQIKSAKDTLSQLIDLAGGQLGKSQKAGVDLIKKLIGPAFQAIEDSQGVLVTAEFRPSGLAVHAQTEMRSGSATAETLKGSNPVAFADMGKLPAGRMNYNGIKLDPAVLKALGGFLFGAVGDADSKEGKAIAAAVEELVKAKPGARIDAMSIPPAGVQVLQYEDPAKAVEAQLKLLQALAAGEMFQSGVLKEKPKIQVKAEKFKGFELNAVQMAWDIEKMTEEATGGQPLPEEAKKQLAEGMKKLLGENLNLWFGTDGKVVVQVTAKDWKSAEKLLDQYFNGTDSVSAVKAFAEIRKELPAEATALTLFDIPQYIGVIGDFVVPLLGQFAAVPPNFPAKPEKGVAAFVGTAVTLRPERGSFDLFVSASAAKEFYNSVVRPLRGGN